MELANNGPPIVDGWVVHITLEGNFNFKLSHVINLEQPMYWLLWDIKFEKIIFTLSFLRNFLSLKKNVNSKNEFLCCVLIKLYIYLFLGNILFW